MIEAYIVDAVETLFGKRDGSFRDTHPQDLAAPLRALDKRNGLVGQSGVEDAIDGCAVLVDEQRLDIGRLTPMVAS